MEAYLNLRKQRVKSVMRFPGSWSHTFFIGPVRAPLTALARWRHAEKDGGRGTDMPDNQPRPTGTERTRREVHGLRRSVRCLLQATEPDHHGPHTRPLRGVTGARVPAAWSGSSDPHAASTQKQRSRAVGRRGAGPRSPRKSFRSNMHHQCIHHRPTR